MLNWAHHFKYSLEWKGLLRDAEVKSRSAQALGLVHTEGIHRCYFRALSLLKRFINFTYILVNIRREITLHILGKYFLY